MNKRQLSILIASLFVAAPALAQSDPFVSTGSVTAGGIYSQSNDTKDPSKFQEYQDLDSGMLSNFGFTGRNSQSWIDAYGENFGRDDTYFSVRGGMYDVFKARAYTNWMPHNFLFNGITPFAGSGTSNQTATFQKPNLGTWTNVDIGYERKDTGGYFEWQQQSPFYFRVDGNQVKFDGSKVGGSSNTTSPGGGYVDLSLPVEYTTNNVAFEAGYTTRTMTFTASFLNSNFSNDNAYVNWNNPSFASQVDRTYLAPDNQYQRLALNGVVRALPWNSTLAARYTWDKTTSDFAIDSTRAELGDRARLHQSPARPHELRRRRDPADVHAGLVGDAARRARHQVLLQLAEDGQRQHRRDLLSERRDERRGELRRHVRERPVELQEAERGHRPLVPDQQEQPDRRRLRLQPHHAEPDRLRRHHVEHLLGRVQVHGDGRAGRAPQVLVPRPQFGLPGERCGRERERPALLHAVHPGVRPRRPQAEPRQADGRLGARGQHGCRPRVHLQGQRLRRHDAGPHRRPAVGGLRQPDVRHTVVVAPEPVRRLRERQVRRVSPVPEQPVVHGGQPAGRAELPGSVDAADRRGVQLELDGQELPTG